MSADGGIVVRYRKRRYEAECFYKGCPCLVVSDVSAKHAAQLLAEKTKTTITNLDSPIRPKRGLWWFKH